MKHLKAYHLAHPFLDYNPQNNKILMSPCSFSPQNLNHHSSTGSSVSNIFENNEEMRIRKLEINKQKQYDLLGVKQIRKHNIYKNKKKQDRKSNRENTASIYANQRQSKQFLSNHNFLTKQEVLKLYPSHQPIVHRKTATEECYSCSNRKHIQKKPTYAEPRFSHQNTTNHSRIISPKFSLNRLKQKMLYYQSNWSKQIVKKADLGNQSLKSKRKKNIIHKSVIQNKEQSKIQLNKVTSEGIMKQNVLLLIPWDQNLRNNNDIRMTYSLGSKTATRLIVCGKNKYIKELKWIQQKDNEGYFFKKNQTKK